MKDFLHYLHTRPVAFISLIILILTYIIMILSPFIAPYSAITSYKDNTFHPSNLELYSGGIRVREYRVIDKTTWDYAKVRDTSCIHKIKFFVRGDKYKLLGLLPLDLHLFGSSSSYPLYLLGADNLGRDLFSRIVLGSRISLTIGFVASFISLFLAVFFGGISGYFGGKTDFFIMRACEFFMLIPTLYFILFLRSLINTHLSSGASYALITIIMSLVGWPGMARTIRGMVFSIKEEEFVTNAKLESLPSHTIIARYILPSLSSIIIVSTALSIPSFIMSETTLSYLGLGITDPSVSWGSLINKDITTLSNLKNFPWLLIPGLLLIVITLAFNFIADALRDYFDPYNAVFTYKKAVPASNPPVNSRVLPKEVDALLKVIDLSVTFLVYKDCKYKEVNAVRKVSFTLPRGKILGIVGESGSGKSVTTSAIPCLLPKNARVQGSIYFSNHDGTYIDLLTLKEKDIRALRGSAIALVYQEASRAFDPLVSIGDAFYETLKIKNKITKKEAYKRASLLLSEVGIPDSFERLKAYPHQFSGGQLQRISIALALSQTPSLLIADEITTGLDVTIQTQIIRLLLELKERRHLSIIFISHNIDLIKAISDNIVVLYGGVVMEEGEAGTVINSPRSPYTKALLSAVPNFSSHYTTSSMKSISGSAYNMEDNSTGCPFYPRCACKIDACLTTTTCYKMQDSKQSVS